MQDLADESLEVEHAVDSHPNRSSPISSHIHASADDTDGQASSSVQDEDFEVGLGFLNDLTGGRSLLVPGALEAVRVATKCGSAESREVSKALKSLVRASAKASRSGNSAFLDRPTHSAGSGNHNDIHNKTILLDADDNGDGNDNDDEPLVRHYHYAAPAPASIVPADLMSSQQPVQEPENENTTDYSNHSGHAGDKSNSDDSDDNDSDDNAATGVA